MGWARIVASGTGSLGFTDDVPAGRSIRMNSEVYRASLSALIQPNVLKQKGWSFIVRKINDHKDAEKETNTF